VKGRDRYLYRAVDSTVQTIDFLLTDGRDAAAAKRFFRTALWNPGNPMPRVIHVDRNPAYGVAVRDLKQEGTLEQYRGTRPSKRETTNLAGQGLRFCTDGVADIAC